MNTIIERYKDDPSSVIQALQDTQNAYGYISQAHLKQISATVGAPYSYTYAIATFYKAFALKERGEYILKVCDGTACHLKLSEDLIAEIRDVLGIEVGETTPDKRFTLEQVNCLGACAMAPVLEVNGTLHGKLTRKKVRALLKRLQMEEAPVAPAPAPTPPQTEAAPPQPEPKPSQPQAEPITEPEPASSQRQPEHVEQPTARTQGTRIPPALTATFTTIKKGIDVLGDIIDYILEGK